MTGKMTFAIPNTGIVVAPILAGPAVEPRACLALLNATQHFLMDQLAASGDGPVTSDPWTYDLDTGVYVSALSKSFEGNKEPFTWGILNATMGWLIPHLAPISKYRQQASIHVRNNGVFIGGIGLWPGYTGVNTPQTVGGVLGPPSGMGQFNNGEEDVVS